MKTILLIILIFCHLPGWSEVRKKQSNHFKKEVTMNLTNQNPVNSRETERMDTLKIQIENKEAVRNLYENIFNNRKLEELNTLISNEYINELGGKGVEGFKKQINGLITAFPDAHWNVEKIIAEGNYVAIKQRIQGTQTGQFQNIAPTNRTISLVGIGIYEFKDGKIIHSQIQTDRLGFMQQLEIIPNKITLTNENAVYFVDKFFVPKTSIDEFTQQMKSNQAFIANLSGYIKREAVQKTDGDGNLTIITIAVWESQDKLDEAKQSVQTEFKRIGFNPAGFYQRLNIKMEREIYSGLKE